jgi:hypothetical protein
MNAVRALLASALAFAIPGPALAVVVSVPGTYATVQEAVQNAPDGAVIEIAPGTYPEQVSFDGLTRSLTVRGTGADPSQVVLEGGGTRRPVVRVVDITGSLMLENLTIRGGHGGDYLPGGLLLANSRLLMTNVVVEDNTSALDAAGAMMMNATGLFQGCVFRRNRSDHIGGAILMVSDVTVVFEGCEFSDNESGLTDPVNGYGGAMVVHDSSPTFLGCTFRDNLARYAAGAIAMTSSYDRPTSLMTLRDCLISGNQAVRGDAGQPGAEGGGIHIEDNSHAVMERCVVRQNSAHRGGGLNNFRARWDVTDSIIEDNVVTGGDIGAGTGGGIFAATVNGAPPLRDGPTVNLTRTVVRRNSAYWGGGIFITGDFGTSQNRGTLTLDGAVVTDNEASDAGGGIYAARTTLTATGSVLSRNTSLGAYGGGLLAGGSTLATLQDTTIADNETADQGGGIYIDQGGALHLQGVRLIDNHAGSSVGGGGIAVGAASGGYTPPPITGEVTGSAFAGNTPYAIYEADCDLATWSDVTYTGNTFQSGGSVYWRACNGASASVASFNGVGGKASGNTSAAPNFARLVAAPGTITPGGVGVLEWATAAKPGLAIDHGAATPGTARGAQEVSPAATTLYTLSSNGTGVASALVTVTCATLGTPVPRSPSDGAADVDPEAAELRWYAATGADAYDVYADGSDDPTTLIAADVAGTSAKLGALLPSTGYRWRVVAKSAACATPSTSPVFGFRTCDVAGCELRSSFDGGLDGWTTFGKGGVAVEGGQLVLSGAKTAVAPAGWVQDGRLSFVLGARTARKGGRVLFHYRDGGNYRELAIAPSGRMKLRDRTSGVQRTVGRGQAAFAAGGSTVVVDVTGAAASITVDGVAVCSGRFASAARGSFAVRAARNTLTVDDVRVSGAAQSRVPSSLSDQEPRSYTRYGRGNLRLENGTIRLAASGPVLSTLPFFASGEYRLTATLTVQPGTRAASVLLLVQDEGNYLEALLDPRGGRAALRQWIGGAVAAGNDGPAAGLDGGPHTVEVAVSGTTATLSVDGGVVTSLDVAGAIRGGVALRAIRGALTVTEAAVTP